MEKVGGPENGRAGNPVPCPRCQSSNTKFCYYNNHNVNQPRHFCRDCQRYWTAGGSLRNVPIGAGKRKHKGPHAAPSKPENLPSIFSFHPDQGVYTPSLERSNLLSFEQPGYGESKPVEMSSCPAQAASSVTESQPHVMPAFVSRPQVSVSVSACHDAANAVRQTSAFACSPGSEKGGITAFSRQPSLSLGLNLSKEPSLQEGNSKFISHIHNKPLNPSSQPNARKQDSRPVHCNTERDESTGCSSVTANLGPSVLEAVEVSTNPTMMASTMPGVEQIASFLNPMMALGASMCPPWVWPFIMSGRNAVSPAGLPQVDPTLAAATMGAMASVPPINPAFAAAAMGAMASSGRLPPIDPNVMAAMTASLLQFPQMWSAYMWGLPWSPPWNSSVVNASNGVNKRPASPSPEEEGASKSSKKEHLGEAFHSTGMRAAEIVNGPNFLCPAMCFDAFRPKPDAFPVKPAVPRQLDECLDPHHQQASPHSNPAAQARSAAFQEGN